MQPNPAKKSFLQKQIPTLLGLGVLIVALVAGIMFVGSGTGVFAPRATPATTPKKIEISNLTESSFTISFLTDEKVAGFVKYGTTPDKLSSQSSDDRDQLSGTVQDYQLHHITVRGLKPNTNYYYLIGTGRGSTFDNNGEAFSIQTAQRGGAPAAAKTAYGTVLTPSGAPADGAIVYATIEGVGKMSSLVKSSGSWAIPLSNARKADGTGYAAVTEDMALNITAQGTSPTLVSEFSVPITQSQPVANVTLGQTPEGSNAVAATSSAPGLAGTSSQTTPAASPEIPTDNPGRTAATTPPAATPSTAPAASPASEAATGLATGGLGTPLGKTGATGALNDLLDSTPVSSATTSAVIDLDVETPQISKSTTPVIKGKAKPNVTINITVNSDTQINQQLIADSNGDFQLDIEALKKELEPGEHSATYSYTDPTTGEEVTKTVNFTVEAPAAAATTTTTASSSSTTTGTGGATTSPYGSGNPFPATGSGTGSGTTATRSALPSTSSGVPVSGAVETTLALLIGGFFFIVAGMWSYWVAKEVETM